jgi:hypothetical protein
LNNAITTRNDCLDDVVEARLGQNQVRGVCV